MRETRTHKDDTGGNGGWPAGTFTGRASSVAGRAGLALWLLVATRRSPPPWSPAAARRPWPTSLACTPQPPSRYRATPTPASLPSHQPHTMAYSWQDDQPFASTSAFAFTPPAKFEDSSCDIDAFLVRLPSSLARLCPLPTASSPSYE